MYNDNNARDEFKQRLQTLSKNADKALLRVKDAKFMDVDKKVKLVTQLDTVIRRCSLLSQLLGLAATVAEFNSLQAREMDFIRSAEQSLATMNHVLL
ncbi:MAG: hypothetical protein ACMV0I_04175 [Pseudomonas sp.]